MVSPLGLAISKHKSSKYSINYCLLSLYFLDDFVMWFLLTLPIGIFFLKNLKNRLGTWWEHGKNTLKTRKKNAPIFPPPTPKLKRNKAIHVCWGFSLTIWGKIPKVFITIFNLSYFLYCKLRYVFIHSKREWGLKEIKENYSSFLKGKKVVVKLTKLFTNYKEKN